MHFRRQKLCGVVVSSACLLTLVLPRVTHAQLLGVKCELKEDDLRPSYKDNADSHCPATHKEEAKCRELLMKIDSLSARLRAQKGEICEDSTKAGNELIKAGGMSAQYENSKRLLEQVKLKYESMNAELKKSLQDMTNGMRPLVEKAPAGAAEAPDARIVREEIRKKLPKPLELLRISVPKAATTSAFTHDPSKIRFATHNGLHFMQEIQKEIKEVEEAQGVYSSQITELADRINKSKTPPPSGSPETKTGQGSTVSSAMNPATLMGLASGAAGLAGMMKKQESESPAAEATSPTPESLGASTAKEQSVTKFDSENTVKPGTVGMSGPATATNPEVATATLPGGNSFSEDSDISNSPPSTTNQTKAASSTAPSGGGSGGIDSSQPLPLTRDLSALEHQPPQEEAMQGIGSGGLGNGGSSMPSTSTDPGVAAAEESMKELLTEMKETADEGAAEEDASALADGVLEMSSEDLFPRVRAAHVRSLKQGRVLNGLGEQINTDSE